MANALKRKMDSFLQDPSGSLLWYARTFGNKTGGLLYGDSSWIRKQLRLALRSWSRYQLNRYGCLNLLASRPPNAYPPDCTDLWFLYRQVRQRKPRHRKRPRHPWGCGPGEGGTTCHPARITWSDGDRKTKP